MFRTASRTVVQLTSCGSKATNARTGASLRDIRGRIKSIASIAKLTKTMQLVASSRMKSATLKAENASHLQAGPTKVLSAVESDKETGQSLVITVVSDKGMCGSVNNQAAKFARSVVREDPSRFFVSSMGTKATALFANEFPDNFVMSMRDMGKKDFSFAETSLAVDQLLATSATKGGYDGISIVYNQFKNVITYIPTEITIPGVNQLNKSLNKFSAYEFDDVEETTLRDLFEFHVASSLWGALNSNRNSEMAARMTSMDNATKNANKIVGALTVQYNRGRQAAITTELVEITSGAAAVQEGSS
jgi:F-type H+-transporting ATPase subunit gamma